MITNNAHVAVFSLLAFCVWSTAVFAADKNGAHLDEPITPIPLTVELSQDKVSLGEKLFNDVRLTQNNTMACSSCHQLNNGGDDNLAIGITPQGDNHIINTPTVFNARFNFRQNWDGGTRNLEEQIEKLLRSHLEANIEWDELLEKIYIDTEYKKLFNAIYTDGITKENYLNALTEFEKSLVTPNSKFDQYLRGNNNAISDDEKEGYTLFKDYGCISCHQGVNVGGNLFQKFGIFYNYFDKRGNITTADYGRQNITGRYRDKHVFKVPTLRNIELTAPYFHDGKTLSLQSAILIMGKTQLGITINKKDVIKIEMFLKTLTGEYKGILLSAEKS